MCTQYVVIRYDTINEFLRIKKCFEQIKVWTIFSQTFHTKILDLSYFTVYNFTSINYACKKKNYVK